MSPLAPTTKPGFELLPLPPPPPVEPPPQLAAKASVSARTLQHFEFVISGRTLFLLDASARSLAVDCLRDRLRRSRFRRIAARAGGRLRVDRGSETAPNRMLTRVLAGSRARTALCSSPLGS